MPGTIRRRELIAAIGGAMVAWPFAARAQQGERMRRIGVLTTFAEDDPEGVARNAAFLQALAQLGWTDGRNVRMEYRRGTSDPDRIRKYAAELAALALEVILATGNATLAPLLQATRTVPVVFAAVADPVGAGFVDSLARPGGIITLAARHKLPAVYFARYFVTDGGLISYGPDTVDLHRRAAGYVDRILKGEKPADLPVQAPTGYMLSINLQTARALGLDVPSTLLARADEVIE